MSDQITIERLWDSSEFSLYLNNYNNQNSQATLKYLVAGAEDEQTALSLVYAAAPVKLEDPENTTAYIPKKSASIDERVNDNTWKVSVLYAHSSATDSTSDEDEVENNDSSREVCFQCNAETIHVERAYEQSLVYQRDGTVSLYNIPGVPIGWNGKFEKEAHASGVDMPIADTREQYTRILSYDKVRSSAYRRKIASLVGKVNASEFKGWNAGEAMFMGMSYTTPQRGVSKVKATFDFSIKPNESDQYVCGIPVGSVRGHDYIWAVTGQVYNGGISTSIDYIFKSRVAEYADFSKLGL